MKTYTELCQYSTYEERIHYLMLKGKVGMDTFGVDRVFNQMFYHSREWQIVRPHVIMRDDGCDLGVNGCEYVDGEPIIIHHINPITMNDLKIGNPWIFNPENLISCRDYTHKIIHYALKPPELSPIIRSANDTCPWKK